MELVESFPEVRLKVQRRLAPHWRMAGKGTRRAAACLHPNPHPRWPLLHNSLRTRMEPLAVGSSFELLGQPPGKGKFVFKPTVLKRE